MSEISRLAQDIAESIKPEFLENGTLKVEDSFVTLINISLEKEIESFPFSILTESEN